MTTQNRSSNAQQGTQAQQAQKRNLRESAAGTVESNPLALLAGGIAVGAVIGALVPRSQRERELLAPLGKRLSETSGAAFQAVRDAGKAELDAVLPTSSSAKDTVSKAFGNVLQAAKDAART